MKMFLFNLTQYSNSTSITIRTKLSLPHSSLRSTPFPVPVFITWSLLELIALDHILNGLLFACRLLYSCSNLSVLPLSYYILLGGEKQYVPKYLSKTQNPIISMHILHTVLYTCPKVLTRRICSAIKSFFMCWSYPQFSWAWSVTQGWYCKEKLDGRG